MNTLTLELPETLDAQLTELAKLRRVSITDVAQEALQNYLTRESAKPTRKQLENHLKQHDAPGTESFAAKAEKYIGIAGGESDLSFNPKHLERIRRIMQVIILTTPLLATYLRCDN